MSTYQVLRPFGGYSAGDVLTDDDFVSTARATLLVDQRYLSVSEIDIDEAESSAEPPAAPQRRRRRKAKQ